MSTTFKKHEIINRPILAIVISLIILFLGIFTMIRLPMMLFPSVAPPEVNVEVEYQGANAETVTKAAVEPLERAINGVPGMKYMISDVGSDGVGVIQVIFETGVDVKIAAVNVQNRINDVMGMLPPEVIQRGVLIGMEENAILMYINIYSSDPGMTEKFIHNFADLNILPELKRIHGVGYADILGAKEYAMRIWLKPDRMAVYGISTKEVMEAIEEYNLEASPGKIGDNSDRTTHSSLQYILTYPGRFTTVEQYEKIPVKATEDGQILRIKDIAEVEFGTEYFDVEARFNGKPAASIILKQLPGSNAKEVIEAVKKRMAELKESTFLPGMDYEVSYDIARFMDASIKEVVKAFLQALALVVLVIFMFLQNWRATLITAASVPVSVIGTFFFMPMFGLSLNLITLSSLVIVIGIVVDNAIVVIEAVHAKMEEADLSAKEATRQAMQEIRGAIIASTLVMSAVFIPVSFMGGPSGLFFRHFSLTLAISIVLSGVVALTLTPAMCALYMKPPSRERKTAFSSIGSKLHNWYKRREDGYGRLLGKLIRRRVFTWLVLIAFFVGSGYLGKTLRTGFIPTEDQGMFFVSTTTPPGATLERTKDVVNAVGSAALQMEGVESVSTLAGTNALSDGTGATYGTVLVNLKAWHKRHVTVHDVMGELEKRIGHIKDAQIELFTPPAVPGYGNASGFELKLLDRTGTNDLQALENVTRQFLADLRARPEIASAWTIYDASFPQYTIHVDYDKAAQKGITANEAMDALSAYIGSEYASTFVKFGRTYKVMVQALPEYRANPEDIYQLTVKNDRDEMVPFSAFVTLEKTYGVDQITRYNMYNSAEINGEEAPGYSSGDAIRAIKEVARKKLPRGYDIAWSGISFDEEAAGNEGIYLFLISLLFIYLILSGQYESFLLPLPVILAVPFGIFGAFLLLQVTGLENNIYAQIAAIMLIGLLGKTAILIVEYASHKHTETGCSALEAAIEGARQRLRPVLMTGISTAIGLLPLVFATGAGAMGSRTIGTATLGGMVLGTLIGLVMVPGLYVVFGSFRKSPKTNEAGQEP